MRAWGSVPLNETIALWRSYTSSEDSNLVVITPSTNSGWANTLKSISRQSGSSKAIVIDTHSFLNYSSTTPAIQQLQADGIQTFLLGKSDDVVQALSQPSRPVSTPLSVEKT